MGWLTIERPAEVAPEEILAILRKAEAGRAELDDEEIQALLKSLYDIDALRSRIQQVLIG